MTFDLRLPIGLLFAMFGVILAADGLFAGRLVLGINVNLWWGLVLVVFGAAMLYFGSRARKPVVHHVSGEPPDRRPR